MRRFLMMLVALAACATFGGCSSGSALVPEVQRVMREGQARLSGGWYRIHIDMNTMTATVELANADGESEVIQELEIKPAPESGSDTAQ